MLRVGMVLHGFCGGFFGRDSYGDKRIEAIGHDWVVVRENDGTPNFAHLDALSDKALIKYSDNWQRDQEQIGEYSGEW